MVSTAARRASNPHVSVQTRLSAPAKIAPKLGDLVVRGSCIGIYLRDVSYPFGSFGSVLLIDWPGEEARVRIWELQSDTLEVICPQAP